MIYVTFRNEVAREFIVRREGAVYGVLRIDEWNERGQVALSAALAQEDMHSEPQLFLRFAQFSGFMIGLNACEHVGVQFVAHQTGRVTINVLAFARLDFGELAFLSEEYA